ncbi:Clp1/GlmU family protein [candidate division CSSED10-310 bacterium]|uniref:Clp1/GlmU family protein n=1 Tax=candidate division CSSED10-310 bacterium TaxID=2855610 RepID=A0ABV6YZ58_UNCC1
MKNDFFLIRGETQISLLSGSFDVVGAVFQAGMTLRVPKGKSIILQECSTDCNFELSQGPGSNATQLDKSPYPQEWETLIKRILEDKLKKVILLGEMDTGKTFLCTYLANRIVREQKKVAVIDCDLGQSDIGPPGCLGSSILDQPIFFMSEAPVERLYFVGAHAPEGHLVTMLVGLQQLMKKVSAQTDFVFIDTCGWTLGDGARILKKAKIEILEPDLVVLLQRQGELEHLVRHFSELKVQRLVVAKKSTPTDQMVRKQLRENISRNYFRDASVFELSFDHIRTTGSYLLTGREIKEIDDIPLLFGEIYAGYEGCFIVPQRVLDQDTISHLQSHHAPCRIFKPGSERGHLIGLLDSNLQTLALGIVEKIDFSRRTISIVSPYKAISTIKAIAFGSLKYERDGSEAGFVLPGQY